MKKDNDIMETWDDWDEDTRKDWDLKMADFAPVKLEKDNEEPLVSKERIEELEKLGFF